MTEKDPYRKSGVLLFDPPEDAEPQKQEWMSTADVHCLRSEEHMGYMILSCDIQKLCISSVFYIFLYFEGVSGKNNLKLELQ